MEETPLTIEIPSKKIYSDQKVWTGTLLGGPLVAGYMIASNFKAFNNPNQAIKTWVYAIIATVIIFGGVLMIPEGNRLPPQIIPLIYTGIASYLVQRFQGKQLAKHAEEGGKSYSWWRTIAAGLIGLVLTIGALIGFLFVKESIGNGSLSTKTYGSKKHEIVYDKSNIAEEEEIDQLATKLTATGFFDDFQTKSIYAEKVAGGYELSIPVVEGMEKDQSAFTPFIQLKNDLQRLYPDQKIHLKLILDNLDNVIKRID